VKLPVVPFLVPPESSINHGEWLLRTAEGDVPLPREVPHWDYQTRLELLAPVSVDRRTVTEACELEWDSGLAVIVMARSNHTNAEMLATKLDLPMRDTFDLAVELQLDGIALGGRLFLESLLVVTESKPISRLAPQHPGSILWRSTRWTDLEGVGTQFPTDTLDFAEAGMDPSAGWQFRLDVSDPDARFMSSARLTLNSSHPAIERLLSGAKDDGTEQLLRTLHWDITRQLVLTAIASDAVDGLEVDHEATSVAAVLRNLLARMWPSESTATLRHRLDNDPARIEVHVQQYARLLP
jgi:hypothetical protein